MRFVFNGQALSEALGKIKALVSRTGKDVSVDGT